MELNLITQTVGASEVFFESNSEQPVDCDISLPDYCPDIQRVLKCMVTPRITGVQSAGERVSADGTALVRIIYVSDKGKIKCYEISSPLSSAVDVKGLTDSCRVTVRARTDYANCRAVSQRRADVHGMITVTFKVTRRRDESIITGADSAGIQLQAEPMTAVSTVAQTEKGFPMSEVVEIGQSKPPVTQIVRTGAAAIIGDIKAISNKLLIKGELLIGLLYCADTDDGELVTFEHSMPISQIIELPGVTENSISETRLVVSSLDVQPKADGNGQMKLLDISARISASTCARETLEFSVITDAYSTRCETATQVKKTDFMTLSESFKDSFLCRSSLDFSSSGVSKVLDIWCGAASGAVSVKGEEMLVTGTVNVNVIMLDRDGQINYAERQADFEYKRALRAPAESLRCEPDIQVSACSCSLNGESRVDAKIELIINACAYSVSSRRIVSSIELDESRDKSREGAALTVYFSEEGEKVWNIARKYNTTVEAIMQENSLEKDILEANTTLLIPKVM